MGAGRWRVADPAGVRTGDEVPTITGAASGSSHTLEARTQTGIGVGAPVPRRRVLPGDGLEPRSRTMLLDARRAASFHEHSAQGPIQGFLPPGEAQPAAPPRQSSLQSLEGLGRVRRGPEKLKEPSLLFVSP